MHVLDIDALAGAMMTGSLYMSQKVGTDLDDLVDSLTVVESAQATQSCDESSWMNNRG